jgi:hypothetical protein
VIAETVANVITPELLNPENPNIFDDGKILQQQIQELQASIQDTPNP